MFKVMDVISLDESIRRIKDFLFENLDDDDRNKLIELFKKRDNPHRSDSEHSYSLIARIKLMGMIS